MKAKYVHTLYSSPNFYNPASISSNYSISLLCGGKISSTYLSALCPNSSSPHQSPETQKSLARKPLKSSSMPKPHLTLNFGSL